MSWIDFLGYAASASVLLTFCMTTMAPLRVVAICSNILFATFGALAHVYPVLALHVVLLPVNVGRLMQLSSLLRNIRSADFSEVPIHNFLHLMSRRFMKSG
jgi:CRP/FNR family transcriptional regulator, cyclic AMP receptor protein